MSVAGYWSHYEVVDRSAILTHVTPGLAAPGMGTADLLAVVVGMGGRIGRHHPDMIQIEMINLLIINIIKD